MKDNRNLKLIALLLLVSTAISLFISCGGSDDNGAVVTTTAGDPAGESETAEAVTTSEYVNPGLDLAGEEYCIAAYSSDSYYWNAASYCDAIAEEETGEPLNDSIFQRNRAVEEMLNAKLTCYGVDVSSRNIAEELKKLIMAGEDIVDFAFVTGSGLPTMMGAEGLVIDIASISTIDLSHSWWDQKCVENMRILDRNYAVTGDISLYAQFSPIVYFLNKALMTDFSLENPYDLVREGGWTFAKSMEMGKAVAHDVNGDNVRGIEDIYGMCCEVGSINFVLTAFGVDMTRLDADGVPQLTYNTDRTVEAISLTIPYMSDRNYVTRADHYKGYGNAFTEVLLPMFASNRALFFNNQLLVAMNLRDMEADFGILPAPKLDEAQEEYIGATNTSWISFVVVPATNTKTENTGSVIEALAYYGQKLVTPAYIETTVITKTLRDSDSAEMLELILASRTYDLAYYYNWSSITSIATGLYSSNSTDFASSYAKSEASIKAAIEKTVEAIGG